MNGAGCNAGAAGDVPIMPYAGTVDSSPTADTTDARYASNVSHADETAKPGRYTVTLANGVKTDLAVSTRAGVGEFTFPADRGEYAPRDGPPPDRIRRYFTADDIERWASRIGPGRLHAVQYDAAEPTDSAAERMYRARERSAPPGDRPTNWVYIGQVEAADD